MKTYELTITETGRSSPAGEAKIFNEFKETFHYLCNVVEYLKERYGALPQGRQKIYQEGNVICGFTYSFWNQDISHNSKPWFQTDWICLMDVQKKPIRLKLR